MRIFINSTTQFIIESSIRHCYKYSYLKTKYVDLYTDVIVTCPIHGDFKIYARNHARRNRGCQKCSLSKKYKAVSKKFELTFVKKANKVHNNLYTYLKIPKSGIDKVISNCVKHGKFIQYASSHLQGYGCRKCAIEKMKQDPSIRRNGWSLRTWKYVAETSNYFKSFKLYKVRLYNNNESFYKIGRTYTSISKRFSTVPYEVEVIEIIESSAEHIFNLEIALKRKQKPYRYTPALEFKGITECYSELIV